MISKEHYQFCRLRRGKPSSSHKSNSIQLNCRCTHIRRRWWRTNQPQCHFHQTSKANNQMLHLFLATRQQNRFKTFKWTQHIHYHIAFLHQNILWSNYSDFLITHILCYYTFEENNDLDEYKLLLKNFCWSIYIFDLTGTDETPQLKYKFAKTI